MAWKPTSEEVSGERWVQSLLEIERRRARRGRSVDGLLSESVDGGLLRGMTRRCWEDLG